MVKLHDPQPEQCSSIDAGSVFRLFNGQCTYDIHKFRDKEHGFPSKSFWEHTLPKESRRQDYIFSQKQIKLCDIDNAQKPYAKKGHLLRMKLEKYKKCPEDYPILFRVRAVYSEGFPSRDSPIWEQSQEIRTKDETLNFNIQTVSIGDPFGYGSSGYAKGSCTITSIRSPTDTPTNSCGETPSYQIVSKVESLGKEPRPPSSRWGHIFYDYMNCTSIQVQGDGCYNWWVEQHFPTPESVLGLVMGFHIEVDAWSPAYLAR